MPLPTSATKFRGTNSKRISSGICAAGRRTSAASACWCSSCTLPPHVTAANLDLTPTVAYDGTHGYSDQYLVELPVFLACAREAGLQADARLQSRFPASDLASVSFNVFTAAVYLPVTQEIDERQSTLMR